MKWLANNLLLENCPFLVFESIFCSTTQRALLLFIIMWGIFVYMCRLLNWWEIMTSFASFFASCVFRLCIYKAFFVGGLWMLLTVAARLLDIFLIIKLWCHTSGLIIEYIHHLSVIIMIVMIARRLIADHKL